MSWTLNSQTFTDLNAAGLTITRTSGAPDEIRFATHGAFDGVASFPYDTTVVLRLNGTIRFTGRIVTPTRNATAGPKVQSESIRYRAVGPWADLEEITFEQQWRQETGTAAASAVVLGRDIDNAQLTAGEVIKEILDYAISEGAGLSYVQTELDALSILPPASEETDAPCSRCIANMLRWNKDVTTWFDYSSATPVLHFTKRSSATSVSASVIAGGGVSDLKIAERPDLQIPGCVLRYVSENSVDGQIWTDIVTDSAGATSGRKVIKQTINLRGVNLLTQTVAIETTGAPATSVGIQNWLLDRHPWLGGSRVASISWSNEAVSSALGKVLTKGRIPDWSDDNVETGTITATAVVTYTDGTKETNELSDEQTFTDTINATFVRDLYYEAPEVVPSGNAAKIYNQVKDLHYEGSFTLKVSEVDGSIHPGKVQNLTGGLAAWASMDAVIQSVTETPSGGIGIGRVDVTFGPPEHLTPQDFNELSRANRLRKTTGWSIERSSGQGAADIQDNGTAATTNSAGGRTAIERLVVSVAGKTIDLDPSDSNFTSGKALTVNAAETSTEWATPTGGGDVKEGTTAIQSGKLVLGDSTAKQIIGTLIGINLAGSDYQGYSDSDISTDARAAQISDSRFNANFPANNITGLGADGQIAFFDGLSNLLGSATIEYLLLQYFGSPASASVLYADALGQYQLGSVSAAGGISAPSGASDRSLLYYNGSAWVQLSSPTTDKVLKCDGGTSGLRWDDPDAMPSGVSGDILYHNGSSWQKLSKPTADKVLQNTSGGTLSWVDNNVAESASGTGVSLVTTDGKIKLLNGNVS